MVSFEHIIVGVPFMTKNKKQRARLIGQLQKKQRDAKLSPVDLPPAESPVAEPARAVDRGKPVYSFVPLVLTVAELCYALGISRTTLYRIEKVQPLPGRVVIGGQVRYVRSEIERWLAEQSCG